MSQIFGFSGLLYEPPNDVTTGMLNSVSDWTKKLCQECLPWGVFGHQSVDPTGSFRGSFDDDVRGNDCVGNQNCQAKGSIFGFAFRLAAVLQVYNRVR